MRRAVMPVALTLVAVAGVPVIAQAETDHPRPTALEGSSITWCGDVGTLTADPSAYRDSPVYLGNPPVGRVRAWAREQPGFEEIWIDRDNLGWITVGFTHDAAQRQADLERTFPDLGVVAVEMPYTRKELGALQERITESVFPDHATSGGVSRGAEQGMVALEVNVVTDELVSFLEDEFAGEPFCLDGSDPAAVVQPGPQPLAGDGWRLLGVHQEGPPWYRTNVAAGQSKLATLWEQAHMPESLPSVDFEREVVLWFAVPHGSSCHDIRLDDVIVDQERSLIYPLTVMPDNPSMCTADLAGAYQFFVAVDRSTLPEAPFYVQLDERDPPQGAPGERTVVDADLRVAGTTAGSGGVHRDRAEHTPAPLESGGVREPGNDRYRLQVDPSCGVSYFGQLNGVHWVSDRTDVPEAWTSLVGPDGSIIVTYEMRGGDDPYLDATAAGVTIRYRAARDAPSGCAGADA
jgi:hypothetical protein